MKLSIQSSFLLSCSLGSKIKFLLYSPFIFHSGRPLLRADAEMLRPFHNLPVLFCFWQGGLVRRLLEAGRGRLPRQPPPGGHPRHHAGAQGRLRGQEQGPAAGWEAPRRRREGLFRVGPRAAGAGRRVRGHRPVRQEGGLKYQARCHRGPQRQGQGRHLRGT